MQHNRTRIFGFFIALASFAAVVAPTVDAQNIRIIAPYLGGVTNQFEREFDASGSQQTLGLDDTGLMGGLYLQWINERWFQVNTFLYHSPDVNFSTLWGLHLNADAYLPLVPIGRIVVGGGYELIRIDMETSSGIDGLSDFRYTNDISVPFVRTGYSLSLGPQLVRFTVFPWVGAQFEQVGGEVAGTVDDPNGPVFPPGDIPFQTDIDESSVEALAGINTRVSLFRFVQGELKYRIAVGDDDIKNTFTGMFNVFFTRHLGVSYRLRYSETSAGTDTYNLFGVVYTF